VCKDAKGSEPDDDDDDDDDDDKWVRCIGDKEAWASDTGRGLERLCRAEARSSQRLGESEDEELDIEDMRMVLGAILVSNMWENPIRVQKLNLIHLGNIAQPWGLFDIQSHYISPADYFSEMISKGELCIK
jgi:hypothetical protein